MSASLPEGVPPHSSRLRAAQPAARDRFECSTHSLSGYGRCDVENAEPLDDGSRDEGGSQGDDWEAFVQAQLTRQPGELYGRVVRYY